MDTSKRDERVFVDFSHATDAEGAELPDDEGMPHAGPAPASDVYGEDAGDAARQAAGADPAILKQDQDLSSLAGELPPAD